MTDYLTFEPGEYEVLDNIVFDELVQRDERVRFYTLEEQLTDAYEKTLPTDRRVTSFELDILRRDNDRVKELYTQYILEGADTYSLRETRYAHSLSWVHPVSTIDTFTQYNWERSYYPIVQNGSQPNFYSRLLLNLPRPFTNSSENAMRMNVITKIVSESGEEIARALPRYIRTTTRRHEDKTFSIVDTPIENTEDVISIRGYYLEERPLSIPNPLPNHPFLSSNASSFLTNPLPLSEQLPSLEAILHHAVPRTYDPYRVGAEYLKVFDIRLSDIPWKAWKERFPSTPVFEGAPSQIDIPWPNTDAPVIDESISKVYGVSYREGMNDRFWLLQRPDAGHVVANQLLSRVFLHGSSKVISVSPPNEENLEAIEDDQCALLSADGFQVFRMRGVYRRDKTGRNRCLPLELIEQELSTQGFLGRLPFLEEEETRKEEIVIPYRERLAEYTLIRTSTKQYVYETIDPAKPPSELRKKVLAVYEDPFRFADDKLKDIHTLLERAHLTAMKEGDVFHLYMDEDDRFVVCEHSLAILEGKLEEDRVNYYDTWTAITDGFRTCKFCGEQINADVVVEQDEFNEDGFVMKHSEALHDKLGGVFHGDTQKLSEELRELRKAVQNQGPLEDVVSLLFSLLGVVPDIEEAKQVMDACRPIAAGIAKTNNPTDDAQKRIYGMAGLMANVILLQSHQPPLQPTRIFGTKPLKLDGFPRDTDKPEKQSLLYELVNILRKTFMRIPDVYRGEAQVTIKQCLSEAGKVISGVHSMLGYIHNDKMAGRDYIVKLKQRLQQAKEKRDARPQTEIRDPYLPMKNRSEISDTQFGTLQVFVPCSKGFGYYNPEKPVKRSQVALSLREGLQSSSSAVPVNASLSLRTEPVRTEDKTLSQWVTRKPEQKYLKFLRENEPRTMLMLAEHISNVLHLGLSVQTIDLNQSSASLKSEGKGMVYHAIVNAVQTKQRDLDERFGRDIQSFMLMEDVRVAKSNVNTLRAQERMTYVTRMARKTDEEREIMGTLIRIGVAPHIISNEDRALLGSALPSGLQQFLQRDELEEAGDREIIRDTEDQEADVPIGFDDGQYGDRLALPNNDGRDAYQDRMTEDDE